jgi:hypothetical protein
MREQLKKQGEKLGLVGLALAMFINNALAALPADVTQAMSDAKTDGLAVAGGFLAASIVIAALLVARRGAKG